MADKVPDAAPVAMSAIAVMQPYLFPYLGYFHLLHAVDRFVVLDDVAWINRGWINRNRIATATGEFRFTLPVHGASQNRAIRAVERADDAHWRAGFRRTLRESYGGATNFNRTMQLVDAALDHPERQLAPWLGHVLALTCSELGITTFIQPTSTTNENASLPRTGRILDICRREGATTYVNLSGGRNLYDPAEFETAGVRLQFVNSRFPAYRQPIPAFLPGLSILDVLMRCGADERQEQLLAYELS